MWIWKLLLDQRGIEGDAGAGDASADANADAGQGDAGAGAVDKGTGDEGQAGDGSATPPKFGEFGNDPNEAAAKLFETYGKTKSDFDNFKTKAGLTERNLGALRKTLEASGIRAVEGEDGQIRLEVAKPAERKIRFTDEHKNLFDGKVLDAVRLLIQDIFDEQYEGRERTTQEKRQQMQRFMSEKAEVEELMMGYFPQLDAKNPNFNKAFFDRATAIWQEQYKGNMLKQLSAALRAAQELKIIPQMIEAAKKEGVKIGKDGKKILGPVGGGGDGGGGGMRKLSKDEYFKLPKEKQVEYDKWSLEQK
jgi:hypothetical protein